MTAAFDQLKERYPFGFFADPATLRPLPDDVPVVQAEWLRTGPGAYRDMQLTRTVVFIDPQGNQWRAEVDSVINGVSSPWLFWRWQPPYVGRARDASVIHDVFCVKREKPSDEVHWVFWCMMRSSGLHPAKAWLRWFMTRHFGPQFKGGGS